MNKLIVSIALFAFASLANAANYYDSRESCEAAWHAGKSAQYEPTMKHKLYGDARIAGYELRPLEGDACALIGAAPGKRWVFFKQGTKAYTKGTEVKFLAECQNDIFEIVYLKKDEPATRPARTALASACTTDDCGNTTKVVEHRTIVNEVIEVRQRCIANGQEIALTDGRCIAPQVTATLPVKVESATQGSCGAACTQTPKFNLDRKVSRTDGRCVVAVTYQGVERFIRLSPEKGTGRLMAAVVRDVGGEFDRSLPIAYVGDNSSFLHANATCEAAFQGFTSERSYSPTTRRLGLPGCTVKGRT